MQLPRQPCAIEFYRYSLRARAQPNRATQRRAIDGALVRIGGGHACLHPWTELGDAPLDAQLKALAAGGSTPLVERARACAAADAAARAEGRNLFEGMPQARNHWLVLDSGDTVPPGFDTVKLKAGPGTAPRDLDPWAARGFRLRLDFNALLDDEAAFLRFAEALPDSTRQAIDFIEDPFPYDPAAWAKAQRESGLALAADRDAATASPDFIAVVKPALHDPAPILRRAPRAAFTSYLDHPLGVAWAAFCQAEACRDYPARIMAGGLLSWHAYAPDDFSAALGFAGARFVPPAGPGLGFGHLLEPLPWKPLT